MKIANLFKVVIAGRPNVGKSTLFNRLLGKRQAIVDSVAGITRDRIYARISKHGKTFYIVDTGGYFEGTSNVLEEALLEQFNEALYEADLIVFVMDIQTGIHPMDKQILKNLKKLQKEIIYVVNKVDNTVLEADAFEFMKMGIGTYFPVSAQHNKGIVELEKEIVRKIPDGDNPENEKPFRITIVGKPNVGKSSLVNKLLGTNRSIVHDKPGTTRDAIEVDFEFEGKPYTLIDTAGLTRRSKVKEPVDSFSIIRAKEAIESSDLVIIMFDAERHVENQDMRITRMIIDAGKGCMIIINKWDLLPGFRQEHYKKEIYDNLKFVNFIPIMFTSVLRNKNMDKIMKMISRLRTTAFKRIPTSKLNEAIKKAYDKNTPPYVKGKRLKIYYTTQITNIPATFALFVNSSICMIDSYLKYLENQIREAFTFEGMPIR
ncbi:MAG: hypothetical protein ACD_79C00455G0002, partial [uncultured bacterium]